MSGRGLRIAGLFLTAALCALLSARGSFQLQAQARCRDCPTGTPICRACG